MLDKHIFFNFTSNSYSQFLSDGKHSGELAFRHDRVETAISIHYKSVFVQRKKLNWIHMAMFYSLGVIFLLCSLLIYFKSPNMNCGLLFDRCETVKNKIDVLCLILALASFGLGCFIRPEKDALLYITKKIKHELNSSCRLQIEINSLFNLKTAVGPSQKVQDFESESLEMGAEHSQKVKAAPISSDYGSKDCALWPDPTAVFRFKSLSSPPKETLLIE